MSDGPRTGPPDDEELDGETRDGGVPDGGEGLGDEGLGDEVPDGGETPDSDEASTAEATPGSGGAADGEREAPPENGDVAELDELLEDLHELEESVDTHEEREQVRAARRRVLRTVRSSSPFGNVIRGFDRADAAEALLGSVLFGIPMLVEGGTQEVGRHLVDHPVYLVGTALFGVAIVVGILYVAEFQDVRIHEPIFGFVPRRLAGVLAIATLTSFALMTAWGRAEWAEPEVAIAQIVVAAVPMAIGGALGDILPGT